MNSDRVRKLSRIVLLVVLCLVPGCIERKEGIRVHRDGAVDIEVQFKGDPADFAAGDSLPEERGGWRVEDGVERDSDGNEKRVRRATMHVNAGRDLPDSYAPKDDPQYGTALMFPAQVEIEKRRDGTYYHFRRTYQGRAEARYAYFKEAVESQFPAVKELAGKEPADLSTDERGQVVGMLRTLEALKRAEYIDFAAQGMGDEWPQDYGLILRKALLDHYAKADPTRLITLLSEPESSERDAAINKYGSELVDAGREKLRDELRGLRVPNSQIEKFFELHDGEEARRAVTEDLNDESWEVRVQMPGEIVAHNATTVEGDAVIWQFSGKALNDRDQVLMVTSRVEKK